MLQKSAQAYCSETEPVMMCHDRCARDGDCHKQCPLPKNSELKEKIVDTMACHAKCGYNQECHHECGCPFHEVRQKCSLLKPDHED